MTMIEIGLLASYMFVGAGVWRSVNDTFKAARVAKLKVKTPRRYIIFLMSICWPILIGMLLVENIAGHRNFRS